MLSVILTILKIIGITLAVLIGLVLLIVLLVGFVPVRYRADAKYPAETDLSDEVISRRKRDALMNKVRASDEEGSGEIYGDHKKEIPVKANVVVSWLLHFVHVSASLNGTDLIINAKVLGLFRVYSNDPEYVKKKEEKRKKKEEKEKAKAEKQKKKDQDKKKGDEEDDEIKSLTTEEDIKSLDTEKETEKETNKDTNKETDKEENSSEKADDSDKKDSDKKKDDKKEDKDSAETDSEEEEEDDDSWWFDDEEEESSEEPESKGIIGKIKAIPKKIKEKLKAIREKFKNIKQKIRKLNKKKNYILDMKDDERVINGINYGKKKLFLIIKRVLPKKLKGRVAFGMDDPATTGYITGAASLFFPIWGPHFDLEPDFENKKLEADVDLKGRIILAMLVIPAVKVWFNKDIKYIRKKIRGFKKL